MPNFKNIELEQSLLESAVHLHNLTIGTLNLHDFNLRIGKDYKVIYRDSKFHPVEKSDLLNRDIAHELNFYVNWSRNLSEDSFLQTQTSKIKNKSDEILGIYNTLKGLDKLKETDIYRFKSQTQEFITKYQGFCPKGFLNSSQSNIIKSVVKDSILSLNEPLT